MTMQPQVNTASPIDSALIYRHICGWCRRDLGALWHDSQHHSYAICDTCKQIYFAGLYDAPEKAAAAPEKAAARSWPQNGTIPVSLYATRTNADERG
jgi:hypothetical protein